jgi:predicted ArsR family transcriptional regulator
MAKAKSSKAKTAKPAVKKQKLTPGGKSPAKRTESKQQQLIAMLQRPEGATIDELAKKLEWQPHTVRGAIAGALKKRLKLKVDSEKEEGRGRVYRIPV